jgi:hypothetical protein
MQNTKLSTIVLPTTTPNSTDELQNNNKYITIYISPTITLNQNIMTFIEIPIYKEHEYDILAFQLIRIWPLMKII